MLRKLLLVYFVSIVLIVLFAFGWSAYRIAYQSATAQQTKILEDHANYQAKQLSGIYLKTGRLGQMEKALTSHQLNENYADIITDRTGKPALPGNTKKIFDLDIKRFAPETFFDSNKQNGYATIDKRFYIWVQAPIPETPYNLLHVLQSDNKITGPVAGLASRIVVTALVILWFAVWAALIISTQVAKKLKAKTDELEYQSTHDALTGLPNRILLQKELEHKLEGAKNSSISLALIMMDLDRFKEINDTLGHDVGDALLREVGNSLSRTLWDSDLIARMGGDEFALMLPIADTSHCNIAVSKILRIMDEPFLLNDIPLEIGASLGIAVYPTHGKDASSLIRCAEVAMYIAKDSGEPYTYYDPEKDPHSLKRLKLSGELRLATENDQLSLYYQPKMDLTSRQITGVEALLRWNHPDYGFVPPDEFIPLAEQSGAIRPLTEWVLDTAIKQCVQWNRQGIPITVSVNLSARSLHDTDLPRRIDALLKTHGLPATRLELEITETAIMMDPDRALEILNQLNSTGIKLSIDDFGTGYTSLSYLKQLPVDDIKIDKSFVMDMVQDYNNAIIVQSVINLAHSMGRGVIAEGVENRTIVDELSKLGCDTIQGYFLSRPVPPDEFEEWLQNGSVSSELGLRYQAL